jgi:glycosyltransferase involved in cell wall biosynthesis
MKILHITGEYPPLIQGGLGTYVYELTKVLSKTASIEILLLKGEASKYNQIPTRKARNISIKTRTFNKRDFENLQSSFLELDQVIKKFDLQEFVDNPPDIIHVHDWHGGLWGAVLKSILNIPLVFTSHLPSRAGFTYSGHAIPLKQKMHLENLAIRIADKIISPSAFIKDTIHSEYNCENSLIEVIENGINFELYKHEEPAFINSSSTLKLISASRLNEQKGIEYLVEIGVLLSKKNVPFHITVAGDGDLKTELASQIRDLKLEKNFSILGFLNKEKLVEKYKESNIFISTSIYEPFGLVILEAMASGLPVVSFNIGGIREIIKNAYNGVLVNPGDSKSFAKEILKLQQNNVRRKSIVKNGLETAKKYDWKIISKKITSLYEQLMDQYAE